MGVYNRINKRTVEFGDFDSQNLKDHSCASVVNEFQNDLSELLFSNNIHVTWLFYFLI